MGSLTNSSVASYINNGSNLAKNEALTNSINFLTSFKNSNLVLDSSLGHNQSFVKKSLNTKFDLKIYLRKK